MEKRYSFISRMDFGLRPLFLMKSSQASFRENLEPEGRKTPGRGSPLKESLSALLPREE